MTKEFSSYNSSIKKLFIKRFADRKLLKEFPFYYEPNIAMNSRTFKKYKRSFTVEVTDWKYLVIQSSITKSSCRELLKDLLIEMKGLEHQKLLAITFIKEKGNDETENVTIYSSSKPQIIINDKAIDETFDTSFQTTLNKIENWTKMSSGWVFKSVDGDYINIFIYKPLAGYSNLQSPKKLRNSKKD